MTAINEVTAVFAVILHSMVMIGYWPQLLRKEPKATIFLARALFLIGAVIVIRATYYDLWRTLAVGQGWVNLNPMSVRSQVFNGVSNVWFSLASFYGLQALHHSIPEKDRANWPWWKAALYPHFCSVILRRAPD